MILSRAARPGRGRTRGSSSRAPTSSARVERGLRERARPRFVWTITPVAFRPVASSVPVPSRAPQRRFDQVAGISPRRYLFPRARESLARRLDRQRLGFSRQAPVAGELVNRREIAQLHCAISLGRRWRQ